MPEAKSQSRKKPTPRKRATPTKTAKPDPAKLKGIGAKLAWVQHQTKAHVAKTGHNEFNDYDYFEEHGVIAAVEGFLEQANVGFFPDMDPVEFEQNANQTKGVLHFTVYDASLKRSDPDWGITARFVGLANDKQDKGPYKLMTMLTKYAFQKVFGLKTQQAPDADAGETPVTEKAPEQATNARPQDLAKLRADAQVLVTEGIIEAPQVTAWLTSTFGKSQVTDLSKDEAKQFRAQINEWKKAG